MAALVGIVLNDKPPGCPLHFLFLDFKDWVFVSCMALFLFRYLPIIPTFVLIASGTDESIKCWHFLNSFWWTAPGLILCFWSYLVSSDLTFRCFTKIVFIHCPESGLWTHLSISISILFYSILFYLYSILFSILFYSILFYSILFYSILFYSILFYSSCFSTIYYINWY